MPISAATARIGYTVREMLIAAGAQSWNVPVAECYAAKTAVHHRPTNRSMTYGQLAATAAMLMPPDMASVPLKPTSAPPATSPTTTTS